MMQALADLHRHLDGSLRLETLRELAAEHGVTLAEPVGFFEGMGLEQALSCFATTLSVLQSPDAVKRVASEVCEDAVREGVSTLEIRFAPQLHRGGAVAEIVDAALDGVDGRAGVILCGLYGEAPAVLAHLVDIARSRAGVVGIDLAGAPHPRHTVVLEDYAAAFCAAREAGLGRTVHAGEGRPADEIRRAIEQLHAQRIGHGTTLLQLPAVVDLVLERQVTLEACVTSNVHTSAIASASAHPLPRWLELGVKVCVCTDNTLLSAVDARTEYQRVAAIAGMDAAKLTRVVETGHEAAFSRATQRV